MYSPEELEQKIAELLDNFYTRRIEKIQTLRLKDTLSRKNPYLFRAVGVQQANEIVTGLLTAYMSSSDEGIFGDAFFEPLTKFVSGGVVAPSEGVDVAIEDDNTYKAIAVKSGPNVFNAQSRKRQADDFNALRNRLRKLGKHFDAIVGYCYGKKVQTTYSKATFRELSGQVFWHELTGDPDFYLKIIRLMNDKPEKHLPPYLEARDAAINRFTKDFILEFCNDDGSINWEKLVHFNSGKLVNSLVVETPTKTLRNGESLQLTVYANFADGSQIDVTRDPLTSYISDDEWVATVDPNGVVQAAASLPDEATVRIRVCYSKEKSILYKVAKAKGPKQGNAN